MLSCAVYGNELCYFAEMAFVSYPLPETSSIPSAVSTQCRLVTDRQTDIHGAETTFVRSIMLRLGEPVHCCCPLGVGPAKWSCIYTGTHEVTQAPGERRVRGRHAEPQDDRAHERRLGPVYVAPSVASRHCVETAERTELVSARR